MVEDNLDALTEDWTALQEEPWGQLRLGGKTSAEAATPLSPVEEQRRSLIRSLEDPTEIGNLVVDRAVDALRRNFEPVALPPDRAGRSLRFEMVGDLEVERPPDPRDYEAIAKVLDAGGTYGAKVGGTFRIMRRNADGSEEELDRKKVTLARVPTPVYDRSYVVEGKKRHIASQFRRQPGVFTYVDRTGSAVTEFNVDPLTSSKVKRFTVWLDGSGKNPEYRLNIAGAKKVNATDVAKLLGASEADLAKEVGKDTASALWAQSTPARYEATVRDLHKVLYKDTTRAYDKTIPLKTLEDELRDNFMETRLDPDVVEAVTGMRKELVDKDLLVRGIKRTAQLANDEIPEDDREALEVKKVMGPWDLVAEGVGRNREINEFRGKVRSKLQSIRSGMDRGDYKPNVRQVIGDRFDKSVTTKFTSGMLQRSDGATNPLDNMANSTLTTIMGEGAIMSDVSIPDEAKLINRSHHGFLDPAHTAESSRAGVNLHLPARTRIRFNPDSVSERSTGHSEIVSELRAPNGSLVEVTPSQLRGKVVGAFDQYRLERGKVVPVTDESGTVEALVNGIPSRVKPSEVNYWYADDLGLFDVGSASIPMQNSTQGNRAQYSDKQVQQAVPLVNPEVPLVQVAAGDTGRTMDEILGEEAGAVVAAFDGEVVSIDETGPRGRSMLLRDSEGKEHRVKLPKNFPMGGKTPLDSKPRVTVGDKFKRGQVLADSTFTKDGRMALGTNLRAAYLPWFGDTFEDAIVVTERAVNKLASEHLYTESVNSPRVKLGKEDYQMRGLPLSEAEYQNLGDNGIIRIGARVKPGQVLMVGTQGVEHQSDELTAAIAKHGYYASTSKRQLTGKTEPYALRWNNEYEGEVVDVTPVKKGNQVIGAQVHLRTVEPLRVGDKLYGRHGNKGVVGKIIPDAEAPRVKGMVEVVSPGKSGLPVGREIKEEEARRLEAEDPDFKTRPVVLEIIMNPAGVPGRVNPSQVFETFLGKVAKQQGQPQVVKNFGYTDPDGNWGHTRKVLQEAGVPDKDVIVDPASGREIEDVGNGVQYFLKAKQTVVSKNAARGLGNFQSNGLVSKGDDGAQALGELGVYGLLAQDAREFLRDAQMYKSENRENVWAALRTGQSLPVLYDEPEAFGRFKNYLRAAGINPHHDPQNAQYVLRPMTDKDVVELARTSVGVGKKVDNVLTAPWETVRAKDNTPVRGGLFDKDAVGGLSGNRWSRFELPVPLPNPVFEQAIRDVTGIKAKEFEEIMSGVKAVELGGKSLTGAEAVGAMLKSVDKEDLRQKAMAKAKYGDNPGERSSAYRTLRTLKMLDDNKVTPYEAFMRKQVAVVPVNMRPLDVDSGGDFVVSDLNYLYRDLAMTAKEHANAKKNGLPAPAVGHLETGMYDVLRTLMQVEGSRPQGSGEYQGILGTLSGKQWSGGEQVGDAKRSMFRDQVVSRRQAFSARAVLSPDETLSMDEAGVPRPVAAALWESHLEAEWRRRNPGHKPDDLLALRKEIQEYSKLGKATARVDDLLDHVVEGGDRAVVLKRDPVLHKYGIQGFKPRLSSTDTVSINPLVYAGFSADNDGDTLAIFAPLTEQANREAIQKMAPSKNLFNPSSGTLEYAPGHEAVLGLNRMTKAPSASNGKVFRDVDDAKAAYAKNAIRINEQIAVGGKFTTLGRELVDAALPGEMSLNSLVTDGVLSAADLDKGLSAKAVKTVLTHIGKTDPNAFPATADAFRRIGQEQATFTGASLTLDDLQPILRDERKAAERKLRDAVLSVKAMKAPEAEREALIKEKFDEVVTDLTSKAKKEWQNMTYRDRPNSTTEMLLSGARAKDNQVQQLNVAPIAMVNGQNKLVPIPVMRNFSEGLSMTGYLTAMEGARMGAVSKVISVQQPGFLSKQVMNTTMDLVITESDCGTKNGIQLDLNAGQATRDLSGRILAQPVEVGRFKFGSGHALTANEISDVSRLLPRGEKAGVWVRSPMTCASRGGICQKCAGYDTSGRPRPIGQNAGVIAGQAIGERSTQLTLSTFHGGGVYSPTAGTAKDLYGQASSLLRMPSTMGGQKAVVAEADGTVKAVRANRNRGGWEILTEEATSPTFFVPALNRAPNGATIEQYYSPGQKIARGQVLSDGVANPKDLLEATGSIRTAQEYMADKLGQLFGREGVDRRNVEVVVRALTSTVEVIEPGGTPLLPGQRIEAPYAEHLKRKHPGLTYRPVLRGVDVAPLENREDWMAALNYHGIRRSLVNRAQIGAVSTYHGSNPIPALAVGAEFNRAPGAGAQRGAY